MLEKIFLAISIRYRSVHPPGFVDTGRSGYLL